MSAACEVCGEAISREGKGGYNRRVCAKPECKRELKRRYDRAKAGQDPLAARTVDPKVTAPAGEARLAARRPTRGGGLAWRLYQSLTLDGVQTVTYADAVMRMGNPSKQVAWQALLQLRRLELLVGDGLVGSFTVLPPVSSEARSWIAACLAVRP